MRASRSFDDALNRVIVESTGSIDFIAVAVFTGGTKMTGGHEEITITGIRHCQ